MTERPVLVGVGLATRREADPARALEPLDLMIEAARAAGADAGSPAALRAVERVLVPKGRWSYADPGRAIARAIGAERAASVLSTVGVLQQSLIDDSCRRIAAGALSGALVVGGDAGHRILRARIAGLRAAEREAPGEPDEVWAPHEELRHPAEIRAGLRMPVGLYALVDSAFRAARGRSVEAHRTALAELYARFSAIAAENPHAWSRTPLEPEAIREPSERNPMQAFPYARRHCSSWNVDQAAALLLLSERKAGELGLDPSRFVHPLAGAEANHMVPVVARAELARCPGARLAGEAALAGAGLTVDGIDLVELYSCFPVAVETVAAELGIPPGRDLTTTGGMPFAGGPYNNYVLGATARTAELLRAGRGRTGLVGSVSGVMTKQAFGIWAKDPPARPFAFADVTEAVAAATRARPVLEGYAGPARVAAATVVHERDGVRAVALADAPGGRVLAVSDDPAVVASFERDDPVGATVAVSGERFAPEGARA